MARERETDTEWEGQNSRVMKRGLKRGLKGVEQGSLNHRQLGPLVLDCIGMSRVIKTNRETHTGYMG